MKPSEHKFSPAGYSAQLRQQDGTDGAGSVRPVAGAEARDFKQLAEDIRSYLASPQGLNEEARREYNETLNRAVLGFSRERDRILAMIADRLIRLRIHQLDGYNSPYETLAEALFAEVIGLNVLELVLRHKEGLEEIQVVGTAIFEVRGGTAVPSVYRFEHEREVERIQQNLVLFNNDRINPRKRWAEVMLRDGSRVTMTGYGYTSKPTLTIRFYTVKSFSLDELCQPAYRTINSRIAGLLRQVLAARLNIVIIGPTNSGKTNLMKALIAELPEQERIITIEGRHEMMLSRDFPSRNIIEYEADEDDQLHKASQAFKLALRQSPQRIVHAEIRDEDANIYVRACTRGHSGSMTTVHANTLEDVPEAITDMCMLDGRGINPDRLVKRIAQYVTQVGIEMRNIGDGRRVISRIGKLAWEGGETVVRNWAVYDETADDWQYPDPDVPELTARLRQRSRMVME
ncbi:CpaF/VirB11 family protein [Paenibacillus protaetiae]|uniref:CpaF family protein n=1 Tax=Paenibacillus protaetiae TaxID=2509456 RepID=A0A4P6EX81_9BACL|nr:CpaF/VirB11 family protein [Paenibacillus protaetiae]QAY66833.1 CpaF family protein [Paenibacillus protaetiae]